jgi:hypothetical protein
LHIQYRREKLHRVVFERGDNPRSDRASTVEDPALRFIRSADGLPFSDIDTGEGQLRW